MSGYRSAGLHAHGASQAAAGALIRWPVRYDVLTAAVLAGRSRALRRCFVELLEVGPGRRVLDVGCGTGTLALHLAGVVRPSGWVVGVDAAVEMVAAAAARTRRRRRAPAGFAVAAAQRLPFPDGCFDAVLTSLVLHHLPAPDRAGAVAELLRVLRPGGRLVLADFRPPAGRAGRAVARHLLGPGMAGSNVAAIADLVRHAGAVEVAQLPTPVGWLGAVVARAPHPSDR